MRHVWAPHAENVSLLLGYEAIALRRGSDDWWYSDLLEMPNVEYWFEVDGRHLPDPRSPWQPEGVHGPSHAVDHSEFPWTDQTWRPRPWREAILYELHIGTFTPAGTFDAAIDKLEHLVKLGITHVELMPVAEFLGDNGWGYDGVFPFAPHHAYGGPEALKRLVDACHAHGLATVLDVVYNHLGPSGNYLPQFGRYFNENIKTPWGSAVNFDDSYSDEVRRYFLDNALMWLRDYHFDGLRLDAVHAIFDRSAIHFLEELATEVDGLQRELGRKLVVTAESDLNDPRIVSDRVVGGYGLDAHWSDDFHHALHTVLTGERDGYYADFGSIADLAAALQRPYVYAGRHSTHRNRRHGRTPPDLPGERFVACLQNHDQLGNRARGDRIGHLVSSDRAKLGAALNLLSPYVPLLFQGEEWNASSPFQYFVDFQSEPELAEAVVHGRRAEFQAFGWRAEEVPNPTTVAPFLQSKLKWEEVTTSDHADMLAWYQDLIQLRQSLSSDRHEHSPRCEVTFDESAQWLVVRRGPLGIVCNFADESREVACPQLKTLDIALSNLPIRRDGNHVELPTNGIAVFTEQRFITEEDQP